MCISTVTTAQPTGYFYGYYLLFFTFCCSCHFSFSPAMLHNTIGSHFISLHFFNFIYLSVLPIMAWGV